MTYVFGSSEVTPGTLTYPSTLNTDTTTNNQLTIQTGSGAPAAQVPFRILNKDASTALEITQAGDVRAFGIRLGAGPGFLQGSVVLNGTQNPPCLELADGTGSGTRIWSGTGAPAAGTVGTARVGDWYLRRDTPTTANQRVYICTAAGTPGTWSGIA